MASGHIITVFDGAKLPIDVASLMHGPADKARTAQVIESKAGRIVVRHEDGYTFVFQVHDVDDLHMDLEGVTWSPIGAPPDADELEQQARSVAEAEAKARGWLV